MKIGSGADRTALSGNVNQSGTFVSVTSLRFSCPTLAMETTHEELRDNTVIIGQYLVHSDTPTHLPP
jgi:hypothetical protein